MPELFTAFTIEQIIGTGIALLVVFAGLISILYVIWGGFLMIISGWVEEKVKSAVNHIRHAFIGVLLIVAVLFVFPTFLDLLWLEYGDYMRPDAVFSNISQLSDIVFGTAVNTNLDTPSWQDYTIPDDFSDW